MIIHDIKGQILSHLEPLIGLKLSIARRAANLRNFQFGEIRKVDGGTVGEYALHIQCAWRIEGLNGIVTGTIDLWEPVETGEDYNIETWDYDEDENLQDYQIGELLGGYDPETRSHVNDTNHLVVQDVEADNFGGVTIALSGGYRLILFPWGCQDEDWRFFKPSSGQDQPHFVVSGGKIRDYLEE